MRLWDAFGPVIPPPSLGAAAQNVSITVRDPEPLGSMMNDFLLDGHVSPFFQAADTGQENHQEASSELLETKQHSLSPLTPAVPTDIIEDILLHLPGQDILRMKQVHWDGVGVRILPSSADLRHGLLLGQSDLCRFDLLVPLLGVST